MISLLLAGGISIAATSQTTEWPDIDNHTLRGEAIPASQVVCRNRWGTPMLPDGKGGYSLIAKVDPELIRQSLIIPPWTNGMVAYRPLPEAEIEARIDRLPEPAPLIAPTVPQSSPVTPAAESIAPEGDVAPAENAAPAEEAAPTF